MRSLFLATAMLLAACGGEAQKREITEAQASASARTHLSFLLERIAARDPADAKFQLNIRVPPEPPRAAARLTIVDVRLQGTVLGGTVKTADPAWPEFPVGSPMTFGRDVVTDWSFTHNGQLVGAFGLRAQMCNLSELLKGVEGRTAEAQATLADLQKSLDPSTACQPYDPRADVKG